MKFKNISFVTLLLCTLLMSSCEENMTTLNNDEVLTSLSRTEVSDAEILNSREFKALVENRKKILEGLSISNKEIKSFLDKMDKEKRKSLLSRAIVQGEQYMEYVNLHQLEITKNQLDVNEIEKKFFDEDVLAYRNQHKLLKQKHADTYLKNLPNLRQELQEKFPKLSNDDFVNLINTIKIRYRNEKY